MGGHAAGEVAAKLAVEAAHAALTAPAAVEVLAGYVASPSIEQRRKVLALVRGAVESANRAVIEASRSEAGHTGMGSTLEVAILVRDRAFFGHAGDSRAYLVRPTAMLQLTQDHALHETQLAAGAAPATPPARNPLVNAIGMAPTVLVETLSVDLARGDRILLCSDGVHGAIEDEAELARLSNKGTPEQVAAALLAEARQRGGRDNATAVVIEIRDRFVKREVDAGPSSRDLSALSACALLAGLPPSAVLAALASGVELEADEGEPLPRDVASDLCAYVILEGIVSRPDGRSLGPSGLVFAESLVGTRRAGPLPRVASPSARLIRIRHDDFAEVCSHDPHLSASLYMRLARYLAG